MIGLMLLRNTNKFNVFAGLLPLAIQLSENTENTEREVEKDYWKYEDPFKWIHEQEKFAKTLKKIEKDLSDQLVSIPRKKRKKKNNWRKKSPFSK